MVRHFKIRAVDSVDGYYTVSAPSFEEAIERINRGSYDDYVMDYIGVEPTRDFELVEEWSDPEPEVVPKDRYDRTLEDVMRESSDI